MEAELLRNVLLLTDQFRLVRNMSEVSIGQRACQNRNLISSLRKGSSMTIRSYDKLVAWYWQKWPEELAWPALVPKPEIAKEKPVGQ